MASFCEVGNEHWDPIKGGKFVNELRCVQVLNEDTALFAYIHLISSQSHHFEIAVEL